MELNQVIEHCKDVINSCGSRIEYRNTAYHSQLLKWLEEYKQMKQEKEVEKAEWIKPNERSFSFAREGLYAKCSNCHNVAFMGWNMNYCPNCGRKMVRYERR